MRFVFATLALAMISGPAAAQTLDMAALREIRLFAAEFCGDLFDDENRRQELRLDGTAEARLSGVLDKLADIGVEGAASFNQEKYIGVLREDLGGELSDNRSCRLSIWEDLKGAVIAQPAPTPNVQPSQNRQTVEVAGYAYPVTGTNWLETSDLSGLSASELRLMRNEIYARHGYMFQSDDLRRYFSAQPWYRPSTPDAEAVYARMSAIEKANVLTIREAETLR